MDSYGIYSDEIEVVLTVDPPEASDEKTEDNNKVDSSIGEKFAERLIQQSKKQKRV